MTDQSSAAILQASGIKKSYGAIVAVDDVSISLGSKEILGLIGPNGSGKSTLFDCCSGMIEPDNGTVMIRGRETTGWSMDRISREARMVRSFQRTSVFGTMTVEENVLAAAQLRAAPSVIRSFLPTRAPGAAMGEIAERAIEYLRLVDLERMKDVLASELSYGQQKLLQFVSAVVPLPRIVLLDEPFAGVNPILMARMTELIRKTNREHGTAFLIIEHNVDALSELCPRIMVLHQGKLLREGAPSDVLKSKDVMEAYLGG
jgi:ABC-type branched-subunit amino acid transport system ATPase component